MFLNGGWRFQKVTVQMLLTPIVLSRLYRLVFKEVLEEHVQVYHGFG